MTYTIKLGCTADEFVIRDADSEFVYPSKEQEWAEYQAWLKLGNTPTPAPPEPHIVDQQLTADEKLNAAGLTLDDFETLMAEVEQRKIQKKADTSKERGA